MNAFIIFCHEGLFFINKYVCFAPYSTSLVCLTTTALLAWQGFPQHYGGGHFNKTPFVPPITVLWDYSRHHPQLLLPLLFLPLVMFEASMGLLCPCANALKVNTVDILKRFLPFNLFLKQISFSLPQTNDTVRKR